MLTAEVLAPVVEEEEEALRQIEVPQLRLGLRLRRRVDVELLRSVPVQVLMASSEAEEAEVEAVFYVRL